MLTPTQRSTKSLVLLYGGLVAVAVVGFLLVASFGEASHLPSHGTGAIGVVPAASAAVPQLLRALIVLLLTSWLLGAVCRWIHQPPVIGEILAGICLGPSLLGQLAPAAQHYLIPANVAPQLATLSQIGVVLFMFLVGVELDTSVMRSNSRATLAISHASIITPFLLGTIAAIWLYPSLGTSTASFTVFALFLGVSLSVTAFPVLARILEDNALHRTPMGMVALTCAAVDDVTAWCLLALVVGIAKANAWDALVTVLCTGLYVLVLIHLVRPRMSAWARAQDHRHTLPRSAVRIALLALLTSSLMTEHIGIHAIFGAFLLGAMIPNDGSVARALRGKFHDLVIVLLMPAFYALIGLRTQLALVNGWGQWLTCGVIIIIACIGKFGGSYVAARIMGVARRDAASIGILMNTRGLMELVVLDLGFDLGIISPTLFAMMVLMALVTTFLTSPLLRLTRGLATQPGYANGVALPSATPEAQFQALQQPPNA